jgi:hypothetical protein
MTTRLSVASPTLDDLYCGECNEYTADPRLGVCHQCLRFRVDVDYAAILERLYRYTRPRDICEGGR